MVQFAHLHVHSCYSILDGMSSISDLVDKSLKSGTNAIALTDHGNMYGIKEFYDYVKKKNENHNNEINDLKKNKDISEEEKNEQIAIISKKLFKPIIGVEAYVARRSYKFNNKHPDRKKEDIGGWHLILLAKNTLGYENLCALISEANINGFYNKPRIDKELLEKYHDGLIVASACLGGEISQKLLGPDAKDVDDEENTNTGYEDHINISEGNYQKAKEAVMWFKNIFGDDFYLEIQRHETNKRGGNINVYKMQKIVNQSIIKLGIETNTKIIATNDVHFVEEEHSEAHDRLICLSTRKDLDDPKRMRYTKQEWLKTPEEMLKIFSDIPDALTNTLEIVDKIEFYSIDRKAMMPRFDIPEDFGTEEEYRKKYSEEELKNEFEKCFEEQYRQKYSPEEIRPEFEKWFKDQGGYNSVIRIKLEADYLEKLSYEGAATRYEMPLKTDIKERIDFELNTMKTMGFPGYFLIVQDLIAQSRRMGVSVGPGRGSAAGSVVAYCLKIIDIDPLRYDLLFERFLNPDRISLPDIDIDFDDEGRGRVLQWVTDKYGKNRVAHIITYGTMATKSSIKDVARVQKLPLPEADRLAKLIPDKFDEDPATGKAPKVNIENCRKFIPEFKKEAESKDESISSVLKYAEMLEGTVRQTGVHACGVIIGADDLTKLVPVCIAKDKDTGEDLLCTQYEGQVIEDIGLIKMDFLGLKNLNIITETISNIKKTRGIDLNINTIPLDDKKTYELFGDGKTVGVFQFESDGMSNYLKNLKPTKFEDLIAMNALYRPGPMDYIPSFIKRKNGEERITYDLPQMEARLKETYGITVYQEQVMLLSRDLAGFTRGESDELRKAMGKKLVDKMAKLHTKFIDGTKKNGYSQVVCEKIWNDWAKFAKYAFNKSHATCYAWLAYQTAYLKANYPSEYMAAVLTKNMDKIDEVAKFMEECKYLKIEVLGPDINKSDMNFNASEDGTIRFGLAGIKNVGTKALENIIYEREKNGKFKTIYDFVSRVEQKTANKRVMEALVYSGAFDCFSDIKRSQYFVCAKNSNEDFLTEIINYGSNLITLKELNTNSLFVDDKNVCSCPMPMPQKVTHDDSYSLLNKEKEFIGMYLTSHPLNYVKFYLDYFEKNRCPISQLHEKELKEAKNFWIIGIVKNKSEKTLPKSNKDGEAIKIMEVELSDDTETLSFVMFNSDISKFSYKININEPVLINASYNKGKGKNKDKVYLNVNNIYNLFNPDFESFELKKHTNKIDVEFCNELLKILNEADYNGKTQMIITFLEPYKQKFYRFYSVKNFYINKNFLNFVEKFFDMDSIKIIS